MMLVAIGASLGGLDALQELLPGLPPGFPATVVIVQHRLADEESRLVELLARDSVLPVREPMAAEPLRMAHVYLAPAAYHLLVDQGHASLSTEEPVGFARPSIDVLFESAAQWCGASTVAVVLTGASDDGARGAAQIAAVGGKVIVQRPAEAKSPIAPEAALRLVPNAEELPLRAIAPRLVQLAGERT